MEYVNDDNSNVLWIEARWAAAPYAHIAVLLKADMAQIHVKVHRWSHNIYRQAVKDFKTVIWECKMKGCTTITAIHQPANMKLWTKFLSSFGFPEPNYYAISVMEI